MSVVFPIRPNDRRTVINASAGQVSLAGNFPIQSSEDVAITKTVAGVETLLSIGTHYTLSGVGASSGFSAALVTPAASGDLYVLKGAAVLERLTSIVTDGRFKSKSQDSEHDRHRLIQQELRRDIDDAVVLALSALEVAADGDDLQDTLNAALISEAEDAETGADKILVAKDPSSPPVFRLLSLPYVDMKGHKGAVIGGHGGPWAWLQEAILEAQDSGRPVFAPPDEYDFGDEAEEISIGDGNISINGAYGQTIFNLHEGTSGTPKSLIKDVTNSATKGFLNFNGLTFRGTFGQTGRETGNNETGQVFLDHYKELRFSYCRWENIFTMATDTHFNGATSFDHCAFIDIAGDGARMRESKYGQVTNSYFRRLGDDAIAWHGGKYVEDGGYDPDDGSPRREGLVATGNIFADVSAPITALAARQAIISGNIANRFRTYFSFITATASEGTHPASNIKLRDNIGLNCISGIGAYVIVSAVAPRATAASGNIVPGMPASDGTFVMPWDYQNADSEKAEDAFPPIENVDVSSNIFGCTLPAVANYSDWGFGTQGFGTYGNDPAVTELQLRPPAALNIVTGRITTIKDNQLSHMQEGIFLNAQSGMEPAILGSMISGNVLRDFTKRGVALTGVTGKYIDLDIINNKFDGDYRRIADESNADGTYTTGSAGPTAIDLGTAKGARISGNRFSNVARITGSDYANHSWGDDNIIVADIVGLGDVAGNKGVRNLPAVEIGFKYIVAHQDPDDHTNYGKIKNIMVEAATAMPATGFYARGHYVRNSVKTATGRGTLVGWWRMSTGSNHVLDTDWLEDWSDGRPTFQGFESATPGTINDGDRTAEDTITVPGAALGAFVTMSYEADLKGCTLEGYISAADTLSYYFENRSGSNKSLSGAVVRGRVRNK